MMVLGAGSAQAAAVHYELTVNGSSGPVNVNEGDPLEVEIWATVTGNTQDTPHETGEALGLASYRMDLITGDATLVAPVQVGGEWDVEYEPIYFFFGNTALGNVSGGNVVGHGSVITPSQFSNEAARTIAVQRELLATGQYTAGTVGQTTLSMANLGGNVVYWNEDEEAYRSTDSGLTYTDAGPVQINIVPEPTAAAMLGLAGLGLLARRPRPVGG
ncbi:MAG: PEP-CTERM sorting domain-containing protein [Phycisphaeraceae bacterium]